MPHGVTDLDLEVTFGDVVQTISQNPDGPDQITGQHGTEYETGDQGA